MTEKEILNYLKIENLNIKVFEELDSTNTYLRALAEKGENERSVVIANKQIAGRGRRGRSFFSPADSGIYMSILLRPQMSAKDSLYITTAAAVAVCRAVERACGVKAQIKWVNDIYIKDKKVCGILTESSIDLRNSSLNYAVLGIGVNLYRPQNGFPDDLVGIADSVMGCNEDTDTRSLVSAEILNEFFEIYPNLSNQNVFNEYKSRLFLTGRDVRVINAENEYIAKVLDIDSRYHLCVEKQNGEKVFLDSGEVSTALS